MDLDLKQCLKMQLLYSLVYYKRLAVVLQDLSSTYNHMPRPQQEEKEH